MPIFNSLGSNYSLPFALSALGQIIINDPADLAKLSEQMSQQYHGQTFLFYKGRDAIEFALRVLGVGASDMVLTQAFTCHAIEEAITRTGAQTIFVDLAKERLNPSTEMLDKIWDEVYQKQSAKQELPKALLVQHTLGVPANIKAIAAWCKQHRLVLIEDLAQAVGGEDEDGQPLGSYADIVIFSFGRDKMVDAVSGGAVIFKKADDQTKAIQLYQNVPDNLAKSIVVKDLFYPFLTCLIRATHQILIGKVIFQVAKKVNWLTSPVAAPTTNMMKMPAAYAHLALQQWQYFLQRKGHRLAIAQNYDKLFNPQILPPNFPMKKLLSPENIKQGSNLRYSIWVDDPTSLAQELTKRKVYLTDRWYRRAVDFGSLNKKTIYQNGSCPHAEELAQHILNLPTHQGISVHDAQRITRLIIKNLEEKR